MPKLAAFPKAFMQALCKDGTMKVSEWINLAVKLDIDGLAYVKSPGDELLQAPGATTPVPLPLLTDVVDSAKECPGECIHVRRVSDRVEVFGPDVE